VVFLAGWWGIEGRYEWREGRGEIKSSRVVKGRGEGPLGASGSE